MYWKAVHSHRATSGQKLRAEKRSAIATEPPKTRGAPTATTPPTLWCIGRQL